jgi:hypothetical protein
MFATVVPVFIARSLGEEGLLAISVSIFHFESINMVSMSMEKINLFTAI